MAVTNFTNAIAPRPHFDAILADRPGMKDCAALAQQLTTK
jgi:hypothetical protein